ncbi:MAG: site-specific integrase [Candidatus Eremiobacteraeota bacterium]|nr:site-specific integrase [Candidatus Eremiobacteraeota bacterium]MBC5822899.1 site-specific integrase [Candidatus Eremiobacteraeota bacterium]
MRISPRKRRGRGEAAIYEKTRQWKTKDGTVRAKKQWIAAVSEGFILDEDGATRRLKRRRTYLYADTKQDAQEKLRRHFMEHGGVPASHKTSTLERFAADFLAGVRANCRANTARSYEQVLRSHILPRLGSQRLERIDENRVRRLYDDLRRDGLSPNSLAKVHAVLRCVLNVAKQQRKISTTPLDFVKAPRHKSPPARAMTIEQVGALLRAAGGHRLEALFVLAVTTGMRQGELFALRWDAIDSRTRSLSVTQSIEEVQGELRVVEPKTSTGRRRIELSEMAIQALARRREVASGEEHRSSYVFPAPTGALLRKSNFLRRVYFPIRAAAGIPETVPFHALRHTAASMLLLQGVSPRVVQEMLGHADVRLTLQTYSHVLPTLQRQAADALDRLLSENEKAEIGGT